MHTQNLVKFHQFVLKILSGNEIMTDRWNDGQPKSSIAPFFKTGLEIVLIALAAKVKSRQHFQDKDIGGIRVKSLYAE